MIISQSSPNFDHILKWTYSENTLRIIIKTPLSKLYDWWFVQTCTFSLRHEEVISRPVSHTKHHLLDQLSGKVKMWVKLEKPAIFTKEQETKWVYYTCNKAALGIGYGKQQFLNYAAGYRLQVSTKLDSRMVLPLINGKAWKSNAMLWHHKTMTPVYGTSEILKVQKPWKIYWMV